MKSVFGFILGLSICGCGFKFALGDNPYGAPLAPLVIKDLGRQGVGEEKREVRGQRVEHSRQLGKQRQQGGQQLRLPVGLSPWAS